MTETNVDIACPFCGGVGRLNYWTAEGARTEGEYCIQCDDCGAKGPTVSDWGIGMSDAIGRAMVGWNKREYTEDYCWCRDDPIDTTPTM